MAMRDERPDLLPAARARRAKTIDVRRISAGALAAGKIAHPAWRGARKPATYGECVARGLGTRERPCGYVSCAFNLYLDVSDDTGSIKLNFPGRAPDELAETCALRVAAKGGLTLDEVGACCQITRERARQIEGRALAVLRRLMPEHLRDAAPDGPQERSADALERQ